MEVIGPHLIDAIVCVGLIAGALTLIIEGLTIPEAMFVADKEIYVGRR